MCSAGLEGRVNSAESIKLGESNLLNHDRKTFNIQQVAMVDVTFLAGLFYDILDSFINPSRQNEWGCIPCSRSVRWGVGVTRHRRQIPPEPCTGPAQCLDAFSMGLAPDSNNVFTSGATC